MFIYMFRMLFQQFDTSLILIESFSAFLFEVIRQSWIWNILSTSKMKLFLTICICKLIFCRLMILYTQYCPMSVFICVSLLLVPFHFRWFHLQTSEMVFFTTIAIAEVVLYWAILLHAQFLPRNFFICVSLLLSPSSSRSFQVNPACSRWFQLVPSGCSLFQVVRADSRWFQLVPCFSNYGKFALIAALRIQVGILKCLPKCQTQGN